VIYHITQHDPPAAVTIDIRNLTHGWIPVRCGAVG
jgi:hypothetical protein